MAIITGSFQYNGAKITVQKPNGFSRNKAWRFQRMLANHVDGMAAWEDAASMTYYLANTVAVEGNLGFPVPLENPTAEQVVAFVRNLGEADEKLILRWDYELDNLKAATNDPDLLPPAELDEKKSKTPQSE